jgi:glycosyltransferase involved in cell wall biosynthesis
VPKVPLTVTVITLNEAANIDDCLASADFASEIIVVDSGSADATVDIARARGARVMTRDWLGYSDQKNFAAAQASHDWILSVDADERVTPELANEVRRIVESNPSEAGYRIPRVTFHLGRWIRTTDWYPDSQLRLYHRKRASWPAKLVHESVAATGTVGRLTGELQHFAYRDLSHHYSTMDRYTTLAAEEMRAKGRKAGILDLVFHPWAAFMRNYFLKRGVLDGVPGFIISVMNSYYVFLKFAKLWVIKSSTRADARSQRSQ